MKNKINFKWLILRKQGSLSNFKIQKLPTNDFYKFDTAHQFLKTLKKIKKKKRG